MGLTPCYEYVYGANTLLRVLGPSSSMNGRHGTVTHPSHRVLMADLGVCQEPRPFNHKVQLSGPPPPPPTP